MTTKLNIPPARPQTVPRPRLIERLQEGSKYSLILVSAPAGFGKTTLVSEWARQSRTPTAWISLDEGDNDPVRFWDYFIAALRNIRPDTGESILPLLHSSQSLSPQIAVESLLTALINEISGISGDYFVTLDDYHVIEPEQIHDGVNYLLEHIPANMHLVIATRADPPLSLARYRTKRIMLEIGADALRFNQEEVAELLEELKISELSLEDISALNARTEGWAAGLIMAAFSMSGQRDIPAFIADFTGSQRYVMDYLMEEVLHKQTDEIRDFLLKTSILERLCGSLCDDVTNRTGSQDILMQLERGHLFIVPLDESRQWYRYEHLFADILRYQLKAVSNEEEVRELHRLASKWYENNDLLDDAINHTLSAQDWEKVTKLIDKQGMKNLKRGQAMTLINWIQQLPEDVIYGDITLCKIYSAALMSLRQLDVAETVVNQIEQIGESDDTLIQGYIAAQRSGIARFRGEFSLSFELGEKALSLLPPGYGDPRNSVCIFLGSIQWERGLIKDAEALLTEACQEATHEDQPAMSCSLSLLGLVNIELGRLKQAADCCRQALELASMFWYEARAHTGLAILLYEWNDLEASAFHYRQALEKARLIQYKEAIMGAYCQLAHINKLQGNETEALKLLEKADELIADTNPLWARQKQVTTHILFALLQNDLVTATKWGNVSLEEPEYSSLFASFIPTRHFTHILIRLLIAQGKKFEAAEKLRDMYDREVKSGARYLLIKYRVYQALAEETEEAAVALLSEALTMAEPEGYIRTFVDEGKLLKPLLEKALSRGITPEYTRKLITIIEAEEREKLKRKKAEGAPSSYQTIISEREMEVLRLMAEGLSNRQIADRLIISLSTAKNHVHNIIDKLEVKGRTQAAAQARELELL
jgi:LuxR family maltose regulon positive regulatory protein